MLTINFLRQQYLITPKLVRVEYPKKATGWIDQIYYARQPEKKSESLNSLVENNGLKIIGKNWHEIGTALLEDNKTCGQYIYAETTHVVIKANNVNYNAQIYLYNPNARDKSVDIYINDILEKNVLLVRGTTTKVEFNIALSVPMIDISFVDHNCPDGKDNSKSWIIYLQKIVLKQIDAREGKKLGIYIASDSTAQTYSLKEEPQSGWGEELVHQIKGRQVIVSNSSFYPQATKYDLGKVFIDNRSMGARSSKSFILEGRLESILKDIKKDDYLLIQFGDNDATSHRPNRFVPVEKFAFYIKQYVESALARKAHPVLVSPPTQFKYDENTHSFRQTFKEYAKVMQIISEKYQIPMIDLGKIMTKYLNEIGYDAAHILYLQVSQQNYPNLSESKHDITHFQHYGAFKVAEFIADKLKEIINQDIFKSNDFGKDYRLVIDLKLKKIILLWAPVNNANYYVVKGNNNYLAATTKCLVYLDFPKNTNKYSFEIIAFNKEDSVINKQNILAEL